LVEIWAKPGSEGLLTQMRRSQFFKKNGLA